VLELDSPFASIVASGTTAFNYLIMGDQNAGKSTFLHSFSFVSDPKFLALMQIFPILSANFINTRFLPPSFWLNRSPDTLGTFFFFFLLMVVMMSTSLLIEKPNTRV
jgi:hypothetical protein